MSLYTELKRRNVFRVAAAYIVMGWLLLQVADVVFEFIAAPDWAGKLLITMLVLGFTPAIAVAWIFEFTPEGLKRDGELENGREENHVAARRLDIITLVAVVVLAFWTFYEHMVVPTDPPPGETVADAVQLGVESTVRPADAVRRPEVSPLELDPDAIAVLPFTNRSAEQDTAYFVDGVHDDLLTQLAKIAELKVISRTSVLEYRDTTKNMKQIGEELGVGNILEGAVQRAGNRVRINAQLIDANTDKHLWADSFDRELTADNLFDIQADIARSIAAALASALSVADLDSIGLGVAPTGSQAAYDVYLRAKALGSVVSTTAPEKRIELLKRAVELDPEFALAIAEIGHQYTNWYWFASKDPRHRDLGREWLEKARSKRPADPQILYYWADYLYHGELDYEGALSALAAAEHGLPNSADLFKLRSWILRRQGRFEEAIANMMRAIQLDPRDALALSDLTLTYGAIKDLENSRLWARRSRAIPGMDPDLALMPAFVELYLAGNPEPMRDFLENRLDPETLSEDIYQFQLFELHYLERNFDQALAVVDHWPREMLIRQFSLDPQPLARALVARAQGDEDEVRRQATAAVAAVEAFMKDYPDDPRCHAAIGMAQALLGQADQALAAADRAMALYPLESDRMSGPEFVEDRVRILALIRGSPEVAAAVEEVINLDGGSYGLDGLMLDPIFDRHRDHPAFQDLARRYIAEVAE